LAAAARTTRAIVIVLDSVGVGELPDAAAYGDEASDTLRHTAAAVGGLKVPNLARMGLGNLGGIAGVEPTASPIASWGRCAEVSAGKDTTTGHWEMMGLRLDKPFPTFPHGFPDDVMRRFEQETGLGWLGNYPASGTEIIQTLGEEHMRTGKPIVYTSADSVFQIAAHTEVIPVEMLYRVCAIAREILTGENAVGRVIARPFTGPDGTGRYVRTHQRRDFAVKPFEPTVLDLLSAHGVRTWGVGKIGEIFAWQGLRESPHVTDNMDAVDRVLERLAQPDDGLVFANLVDFDMVWGHRNDAEGYAGGLEAVDARIPELLNALAEGDLLIISADHGCDPTTPSTDHSREYVPVIAKLVGHDAGVDLGTRATIADVGETLLAFYDVPATCGRGTPFLAEVRGA
jgi:phosphopentomutase